MYTGSSEPPHHQLSGTVDFVLLSTSSSISCSFPQAVVHTNSNQGNPACGRLHKLPPDLSREIKVCLVPCPPFVWHCRSIAQFLFCFFFCAGIYAFFLNVLYIMQSMPLHIHTKINFLFQLCTNSLRPDTKKTIKNIFVRIDPP
jgi:hypothetical protein